MRLAILFSLKTMESLQNGVATHFGVTALFSFRPVLLASSQHCPNIDADAQCKRALTLVPSGMCTLEDPSGAPGTCAGILIQFFFSFSCGFWGELAKIRGWCTYLSIGAPPHARVWQILDSPLCFDDNPETFMWRACPKVVRSR